MNKSLIIYNPNKTYSYGMSSIIQSLYYIPLSFWFGSNLGASLPIVSLPELFGSDIEDYVFENPENSAEDFESESESESESDENYEPEPYEYREPIISIDFQFAPIEDLIYVGPPFDEVDNLIKND